MVLMMMLKNNLMWSLLSAHMESDTSLWATTWSKFVVVKCPDYLIKRTVYPPIPPLSGLEKNQRYWETAAKGVIYKKNIQDLKISGGMGVAGQQIGSIGGGGEGCTFKSTFNL